LQKVIYCPECGGITRSDGMMTMLLADETEHQSSNNFEILFDVFKCQDCGYKVCFEIGEEPPEEYLQPPLKKHLKLIQG